MSSLDHFARRLTGHEYPFREAQELGLTAKELGYVFAFGMSDDLLELRGCIKDEIEAFEGVTVELTRSGVVRNECYEGDNCPNWKPAKNPATLQLVWDEENPSVWTIKTDIPHAKFEIMEDGENFSQGVVFRLENLPEGGGS